MSSKPALISFALNASGSLSALLFDLVLANSMSTEDYGYFRYVYTVVIISSTFSLFGAGQYAIKSTTKFAGSPRLAKEISALYALSMIAFLFIALVLGLLTVTGVLVFSKSTLLVSVTGLVWISVRNFYQIGRGVNIGLGAYVSSQISDRLVLNTVPLVCSILMIVFGYALSVASLLYFSLAGTLISLAIVSRTNASLLCGRLFSLKNLAIKDISGRFKRLIYIALGEGSDAFLRLGILAVLGLTMTFEDVAIFAVLLRLTDALGTVQTAANAVYTPQIINELQTVTRRDELNAPHASSSFVSALLSVAVIGSFFCGEYVLGLFGEEYSPYAWALSLMAISMLIKSLLGPTAILLVMSGNAKLNFHVTLFLSIVLILMAYFLSSKYGMLGAIYCYISVSIVQSLILALACRLKIGCYPGFSIKKAFFGGE